MESRAGEDLWTAAKSDPADVLEELRRSGALDEHAADPLLVGAAGRASFELGMNDQALDFFERAIACADGPIRDTIRVSYAAALSSSGDDTAAREHLEVVAESSDTTTAALALSQLGLIELHRGDAHAALRLLEPAIANLAGSTEVDALARAIGNAGYCELLLGRLDQAIGRFDQANNLARQSGQLTVAAGCLQNIGYAQMRQGNLPEALASLEAARQVYLEAGDPPRNYSTLLDDLAETYRIAGLRRESVDAAQSAVRAVEHGGNAEKLADATFRLALCRFDSAHSGAADAAREANKLHRAAGRHVWERRSRLLVLEAELASGSTRPDDIPPWLAPAIDDLVAAGRLPEVRRVVNSLGLWLLHQGHGHRAHELLDTHLPTRSAESSNLMNDVESLMTEALRARLRGDPLEPIAATVSATLQAHAARFGDPELRAGASRLTERFRTLFVGAALESEDADAVVRMERRFRALSFSVPRATPSRDPEIAALAQGIRDLERALADTDVADRTDLAEQLRTLESELRQRSLRTRPARTPATPGVAVRTPALADEDVMHLWVRHGEALHLASHEDGRWGLETIGTSVEVERLADTIRSNLRRLIRGGLRPEAADRRWTLLDEDCRRMRELLPASALHDKDLVLSPIPELVALPWSLILPEAASLRVVPSVPADETRRPSGDRRARMGVVIGPRLEFAESESNEILGAVSEIVDVDIARDLESARRQVQSVDILHVVAHGEWRPDSPRFSSVELRDGRFALHELDLLDTVPRIVVLAACDAGQHVSADAGEVLGASAAWIHAGVSSMIAPICEVDDASTAALMGALYRDLALAVPEALRKVQRSLDSSGPQTRANAAAFIALGRPEKFVSGS